MKYKFSFYKNTDYKEIKELVLNSYQWEYPSVGLSRLEFSKGLHPKFLGFKSAWKQTVGIYREDEKIVACVWNEGCHDGNVYFLFDTKKRAKEKSLLKDMIRFSKMYVAKIEKNGKRVVNLYIPRWNHSLLELALEQKFKKDDWAERSMIKPFSDEKLDVNLPKGYTIIDGRKSDVDSLALIHRISFGYGSDEHACEHGNEAIQELREMEHYDPMLDLCILDEMKRPVAMAMIWYDEKMPYCELEPMAVVWWERRKGIGSAILNEAINRVKEKYPNCKGMLGGDQPFYEKIGFVEREKTYAYRWECDVYISWDERSKDADYAKEIYH